MNVFDEIQGIFHARGAVEYFGERVSMIDHALQAAYFAQLASAAPALIVGALLHDIGHLIDQVPSDIADWTEDAHHERLGSQWLAKRFRPEVSEPVRLHVAAKRYLLATNAGYLAQLSPASVITLRLQGGPMETREVAAFETERFYRDAVRLRRWDDEGKVAGLRTPGLSDYQSLIERVIL